MKVEIKTQKGFIQVPLLIVIVLSTIAIGGVGYGALGYHKTSRTIEESRQLTQEENYSGAIEKLEALRGKWIVKGLKAKKQEISNEIEKNKELLEDKSEYTQGLKAFDEENWQESGNLLSKVSSDSPYRQESEDRIKEIENKTTEERITQAIQGATKSLTEESEKAQQKQKELEAKQAELEEEAQENAEEAQQKQKELGSKQAELEEAQEENSKASYDLTSIIKQWKPIVGYVECEFRYADTNRLYGEQSGTAIAMAFKNSPIDFITNKHIFVDEKGYGAHSCDVKLPNRSYRYSIEREDISVLSSGKDGVYAKVNNPDDYIRDITSPFPKTCEQKPLMGDEIIILGYPGIGSQEDVTATRGIISGFEGDYYITDAKIDHGNSGGAAILLKENCLLGLPTYAAVGGVESLGRILNISAFVVVDNSGGGGGGDTSPIVLGITSVGPESYAVDVAIGSDIEAVFNMPLDEATITDASFTVTDANDEEVAGTITYSFDTYEISFDPTEDLANDTLYTVAITTDILSTDGESIEDEISWTFTTAGE